MEIVKAEGTFYSTGQKMLLFRVYQKFFLQTSCLGLCLTILVRTSKVFTDSDQKFLIVPVLHYIYPFCRKSTTCKQILKVKNSAEVDVFEKQGKLSRKIQCSILEAHLMSNYISVKVLNSE